MKNTAIILTLTFAFFMLVSSIDTGIQASANMADRIADRIEAID